MSSVLCFAHGREADWEALCVDYDLAVQGHSFDDVKAMLGEAISHYVEDARAETPRVRDRLLRRRAPWYVTFSLTAKLIAYNLFHRRRSHAQASFPLTCPV